MNGRSIPGVFAFSFALILISSLAFAQNIDKALIVSDITSADFMIAKAAGEKAGIPVLIAAAGEASEELRAQLTDPSLNPKIVILVGGPSVIKPEAERQIQDWGYQTVRLWGVERTGTAVHVAKYFWQEGAACAVLADDTKDSDADTELQNDAVTAAAEEKCPVVPVPKGKVPAEVLELLGDLGVGKVNILGEDNEERRAHLASFEKRFRKKADIESAALDVKGKLVIIAAPNWKDVLGTGGVPSERSVVRIVNNADQTPALAELIKSRNITDVRVVGNPVLAQQISDQLSAANITVKITSGSRGNVSIQTFRENMEKWREKVQEEKNRLDSNREKVRGKMLERLNESEAEVSQLEIELEEISSEAPDTAATRNAISLAKQDIAFAKSGLAGARGKVDAGQFEDARRQMHHVVSVVKKDLHLLGKLVKAEERIAEKLRDEEQETAEAEKESLNRLSEADRIIARIDRCVGKEDVEKLIAKARQLHEDLKQAKAENNQTKVARLLVESRDVASHAKMLGDLCRKRGEISDKLRKIAEKRAEIAERARTAAAVKAEDKFEVKVDVPGSVVVNQSFKATWRVESSSRKQITHTAAHFDYMSHGSEFTTETTPAASGYPMLTQDFARGLHSIPDTFTASITPAQEGTLYIRGHAIIDGKNYWTDEKKIEVKTSAAGY
ncbi:MAG: hypothetical protein HY368_01865 [Candidatus Aenigmarchaeota archaeon]|nr:hypothetical protein [Candidatus Aenigmarchaeota archaeon]